MVSVVFLFFEQLDLGCGDSTDVRSSQPSFEEQRSQENGRQHNRRDDKLDARPTQRRGILIVSIACVVLYELALARTSRNTKRFLTAAAIMQPTGAEG